MGDLLVFAIRVRNVGEVLITSAPVYDVYEADVLEFVGASIDRPRQTVEATRGELYWPDVTQELNDILPGQAVSFTVTFRLIAPRGTTNIARLEGVVDENNQPVPPAEGGGFEDIVIIDPPKIVLLPIVIGPPAVTAPTPTATPIPPTPTPTATPVPVVQNLPCPPTGCDVPGLDHPKGMAVHTGQNALYVVSRDNSQLLKIDVRTNQVLATVGTGPEPWDVVIDEDSNRIYVSNFGANDVWVYDANSLAVIAKIPVSRMPTLMEILPDINTVAVTLREINGVGIIRDLELAAVVGADGRGTFGIAADPVQHQFVVLNRDTNNGRVIYQDEFGQWRSDGAELRFPADSAPFEAAFNPATGKLYVLYAISSVHWYVDIFAKPDAHTLQRLATVAVGSSGFAKNGNVGGAGITY
ncbi:MAG: YncE family protein, partial [Caldilineae bacterium]